jgi:hypothetical protein
MSKKNPDAIRNKPPNQRGFKSVMLKDSTVARLDEWRGGIDEQPCSRDDAINRALDSAGAPIRKEPM